MMEIKEIRELSRMSRAEFSRTYHIPLRTVEDWEAGRRNCPEYVKKMLERIVREDCKMTFKDALDQVDGVWYSLEIEFSDGKTAWVSDVCLVESKVADMLADATVKEIDSSGTIHIQAPSDEQAVRGWAEYECATFHD